MLLMCCCWVVLSYIFVQSKKEILAMVMVKDYIAIQSHVERSLKLVSIS
jgi:hypothetical protein